ncbi:YggU family protein [Photobacterium jeanii]|uniref:UPF0235 protein A3K86_00155 n=1 Tax=Photobacterium jeanii TaxID=858640 RepID=A0A178KSE7_9GAMM|nr:DUF167 family protein YggU [Photobacterium jeanii]OAN19442.1 YggU family protein [Photobacterium jeanii]PST86797.1 YggU family protein [Photobacterium jeanii]
MSQSAVTRAGNDLIIRLYIQPKASRDQIVGLHGDEIKIAITAPPVDGKANAHLTKYLAKQFKVAKGQVNIEKGMQGRHKQVRIESPKAMPDNVAPLVTEA